MPEMTGFEFLEFMVLEKFPTNIDVVMVTSSIFDEDRSMAETFPQFVKDFVSKPLQAEKIKELVQQPMAISS
jgi:CheY-like chemotaxis protein